MRVTVVDSGSPDSTPDMVAREFPAVRLLRRDNIGFSAANNLVLRESEAAAVLLLNPDTEVYAGTLDAALARLRCGAADRDGRGQAGDRERRARPRLQALLPDPAQRPRPLHRDRPPRGRAAPLSQYRATAPRRRRAGRGRRRQRRLHALPRRGGARGRPARRGLLALHGGPRLVPPLLGRGLEGLLRARRRRPARQGRLQRRPPGAAPGDRLPPRHGPLLPPLRRPRAQPAAERSPSTPGSAPSWRSSLAITAAKRR